MKSAKNSEHKNQEKVTILSLLKRYFLHVIFAVLYFSYIWKAESGLGIVILFVFAIMWVIPAWTLLLIFWHIYNTLVVKKSSKILKYVASLYLEFIVLTVFGFFVFSPLSIWSYQKFEKNDNEKIAEIASQAVEKYYTDTRKYPDNLYQLIPDYITEFPRTKSGQRFRYVGDEKGIYVFSYPDKKAGQCYLEKTWKACPSSL